MTLAELARAGKDAWRSTRTAYYKAERAAGNTIRDAKRKLPQSLRSLKDFARASQRGMDWMSENSRQAGENISRMMDDLRRR